jgi:CubicO group peptidase (beta-lactamase class C family)
MGIPGLYFRRVLANADQGRDESAVATELDEWRGGMVQGQVHDENCWSMGGYSGHAGAFGRLSDVVEFAAGLMTTSFLSPKVLREMWTRVLLPPGCERTLGWDTPSANQASCGDRFSAQTVGHLGFTGTSLWMDPQKGIAVILLTNRVHPTRENILIRAFRPRFHNAILDDFFDS